MKRGKHDYKVKCTFLIYSTVKLNSPKFRRFLFIDIDDIKIQISNVKSRFVYHALAPTCNSQMLLLEQNAGRIVLAREAKMK